MAFGQELQDFVSAFKGGFEMVEGARERRSQQELRAVQTEASRAELEEFTDPENVSIRKRAAIAGIEGVEANTAASKLAAEEAGLRLENYPEDRELERDQARSGMTAQSAAARNANASAAATEHETSAKVEFDRKIKESVERRLSRDGYAPPTSAVPVDGATPASVGPQSTLRDEDRRAIIEVANQEGIDPRDLTALMSYETGGTFDPDIRGGKNNNHMGLIQFGVAERKAYGYEPGMTIAEQVRGPVRAYLKDRGMKPGHGIAELYSIVNAGSLNAVGGPRWGASDGNGNIKSHVETIMAQHIPKAEAALGYTGGAGRNSAQDAISSLVGTAKEATKAGLEYSMRETGFDQDSGVPDPAMDERKAAYLKGAGAADADTVEAAQDIIKEKVGEEASPAMVNLYTLAATYDAYMQMGEPEKAQKVAASILGYYRKVSAQYGAVARAAAEDGDADGAAEAAVRAYAHIPDGRELKIVKDNESGNYRINSTDIRTGKSLSETVASPEEILGMAMEVNPMDFERYILAAAGADAAEQTSEAYRIAVSGGPVNYAEMTLPEAKEARLIRGDMADAAGGGSGEGGAKLSDQTPVIENVGSAFVRLLEEVTPEGNDPPPPAFLNAMHSNAVDIMLANGGAEAPDAVARAVWDMTQAGSNYVMVKTEGGRQITFPGGADLFVPEENYKQLRMVGDQGTAALEAEQAEQAVGAERAAARNDKLRGGISLFWDKAKENLSRDPFTGQPRENSIWGRTAPSATAVPVTPTAPMRSAVPTGPSEFLSKGVGARW